MKYLKTIGVAAMCGLMLAGCDVIRKVGESGADDRVVTLADGRRVVVAGTRNADGTISSKTPGTPTAASTPKSKASEGDKSAENPDKKKSDKKKSGKKRKSKDKGKTLAPPKASREKKKKAPKVSVAEREAVVGVEDSIARAQAVGNQSSAVVGKSVDIDNAARAAATDSMRLNGEWTIYSVNNTVVTGEERPYVAFDLGADRFYGNNGCNYINGDIKLGSGGSISFSDVISTMKMCQDDRFQYLINLALSDVVSYWIRDARPVTFLDLKDDKGNILMILRRHNMDFLNGAWVVKEMNGIPLQQPEKLTVTFDTDRLKTHGNTGCNIFNGEMFIDPDKTNSLQIVNLATTRKACPRGDLETEFLLALENVETAIRNAGGSITLRSPEGVELLKLERIDLRESSSEE